MFGIVNTLYIVFTVSYLTSISGFVTVTYCPDRWTAYEGSCYLFGHDNMDFTEAEEYCRHHNAHLVDVGTNNENMFLRDYLRDFKVSNYWIGMTDETVEGVWKWYDTDKVANYTDWGPTEPQNTGNQDCAAFYYPYDYRWADLRCILKCKALCEIRNQSGGTETVVGKK